MTTLGDLRINLLLVAVDGSPQAELALRAAVTAAHQGNARLMLLAVAPDVTQEAARWPAAAAIAPRAQEQVDAEAERLLRAALEKLPADIRAEHRVRRGRPGPRIVEEAREGGYDAILLGARGVGRVGSLFGSVSQYVLHHANVNVFVAHAPRGEAEGA